MSNRNNYILATESTEDITCSEAVYTWGKDNVLLILRFTFNFQLILGAMVTQDVSHFDLDIDLSCPVLPQKQGTGKSLSWSDLFPEAVEAEVETLHEDTNSSHSQRVLCFSHAV